MNEKTFQYKRSTRIDLVLLVILWFLWSAVLFNLLQLRFDWLIDPRKFFLISEPLEIWMVVIGLLVYLWLNVVQIFRLLYIRNFRLGIDDEKISFILPSRRLFRVISWIVPLPRKHYPGIKQDCLYFKDIKRIAQNVIITTEQESDIQLGIVSFEDGQMFMDQLCAHLEGWKIHESVKPFEKPDPKRAKMRAYLDYGVGGLLFLLGTIIFMVIPIWESAIWHPFAHAPYANFGVYSFDADGSLWTVSSREDEWLVWKITRNDWQNWKAPTPDGCDACWLKAVGHDSQGNPSIIFSRRIGDDHEEELSWDGFKWSDKVLDEVFDAPQYLNIFEHNSSFGTQFWRILNGQIYHYDLDTHSGETTPLPADAQAKGVSVKDYRVNPDGSVLVLAYQEKEKKATNRELFLLRNDQWVGSYRVSDEEPWFYDYCLDSSGKIWVLGSLDNNNEKGIGTYESNGSVWTWYPLTEYYPGQQHSFKTIQVDALGQVWLTGWYDPKKGSGFSYFLKVLAVNGSGLDQVVEYTEENTNLDLALTSLALSPDGRMWTMRDFAWMDTNHLRQPLPEIFVKPGEFASQNPVLVYAIVAGLVIFGLGGYVLYTTRK